MQELKENSKILTFSRFLIVLAVFLVPFIFYPNSIYFYANLKLMLIFGAVILILLLWSMSRLKKDSFSFPKNLLILSIILVLATSLLSSIFSENPIVSIFGSQLSTLTFFGIFSLFAMSLIIGSLFVEKSNSYKLTIAVYFSLILAVIINLLYIFIDKLPDFGFFVQNSVNTIGKWSDLGVISALVIIISYLIIENNGKNKSLKIISWIGLVSSSLLAIIVSETVTWLLLGIVSIAYLVYKIITSKVRESEFFNKDLPYTTIAMILLSFVMILSGSFISTFSDQLLRINYEETKPGISSTFEISKETFKNNLLFGEGLNRFERAWQLYKPETVNSSDFWGTDFKYGYSYLFSIPAQSGLLGTLAWLFLLVILIWSAIKLLFKDSFDYLTNKLNLIHVFSLVTFVLILLIHVPSTSVIILFFVFTGLFLGSLIRNNLYSSVEVVLSQKPKTGFLFIFSIIVLMISSIYMGYIFTRQSISTLLLERANYNLATPDLNLARNNILLSINSFASDLNLRALSQYYQIEIGRLLQNQSLENQQVVDTFRSLLVDSINSANAAVNFDRNNYQNYIALASIYEQLISLEIEGSYDQAIALYQEALNVNPNNPGIYLDMARSAFANGQNDTAREYISEALNMNPRFAEAAFLLSQIQISEGDIEEAIRSVEASINIQPNNPNLYFQLGLLRFNQENFGGSISSFERAVILNPLFSNAKYFLGLSYQNVGRTDDAIAQFEDLEFLNPDNQEVEDILNSLRTGSELNLGSSNEVTNSIDELPINSDENGELIQ
jgi:tetratricopeptide (TPR) repeat protein